VTATIHFITEMVIKRGFRAVVLNRGASVNFQGAASPNALYNMESYIIKFTNKCTCFYNLFMSGGLETRDD